MTNHLLATINLVLLEVIKIGIAFLFWKATKKKSEWREIVSPLDPIMIQCIFSNIQLSGHNVTHFTENHYTTQCMTISSGLLGTVCSAHLSVSKSSANRRWTTECNTMVVRPSGLAFSDFNTRITLDFTPRSVLDNRRLFHTRWLTLLVSIGRHFTELWHFIPFCVQGWVQISLFTIMLCNI